MEAGFPPGLVRVVQGEGPTVGAALVRARGVDKLVFTGSGLKYGPPALPAPTHLEGSEEEVLLRVQRVVRP